jgi:RNA recognition motif-containing protein
MNIYVGNLSWAITSDDLFNLFSAYGEVASAKVVTDKFNNNRSKGFGFVEMADDEAARTAISNLNETEVSGRKIIVNESTPKPEGEFRKKSYGNGGGGYKGGSSNGGGYRGGRQGGGY